MIFKERIGVKMKSWTRVISILILFLAFAAPLLSLGPEAVVTLQTQPKKEDRLEVKKLQQSLKVVRKLYFEKDASRPDLNLSEEKKQKLKGIEFKIKALLSRVYPRMPQEWKLKLLELFDDDPKFITDDKLNAVLQEKKKLSELIRIISAHRKYLYTMEQEAGLHSSFRG